MRCMHCGNELQNTKCAGCGFDHATGEYMTVFPLNAVEEREQREAIASREARIQTEREEALRREAEDVAKRRQKRNQKEQWWVSYERRKRRMQVVCGISLLLSISFLVFVGLTCNVRCNINGCSSYYDVEGWIYLLFSGVVSAYNIYIIMLRNDMSLRTQEAYFALLVCYIFAGAVELLVILPHITDWLRVSFLLLLICSCCVVVSISIDWQSDWLGGVACCLLTLYCMAGLLFWPNIFSKPINVMARPLYGNLFCETYYSEELFGMYLTSGKVKHVDTNDGVYEGDCVNGIRTGNGMYIDEFGDVYEGEFVRGEQTGFGKKTYTLGGVYEGEFVDGHLMNGTYTNEIGEAHEVYEGEKYKMRSE